MAEFPEREAVGTLLRQVHDLLEADLTATYPEFGLPDDYRPRFSPVIRALVAEGPLSIRDVAAAVGVTHSAASQTVAQMVRSGLLDLRPGEDARRRIAHLTGKARALLPAIDAEWAATAAAMSDVDAELPAPLAEVLLRVLEAAERRPLRDRIRDAMST